MQRQALIHDEADCTNLWNYDCGWSYTSGTHFWTYQRSQDAASGRPAISAAVITQLDAADIAPDCRDDIKHVQVGLRAVAAKFIQLHSNHELAVNSSRILLVHEHEDTSSNNLWHRLVTMHAGWFALHAARWRLGTMMTRGVDGVDLLLHGPSLVGNVTSADWLGQMGWEAVVRSALGIEPTTEVGMLSMRPQGKTLNRYRVVVAAPLDGLMWDLAWDSTLSCYGAHPTYPRFASELRRGLGLAPFGMPQPTKAKDRPTICWISRSGALSTDPTRRANEDLIAGWVTSICVGRRESLLYKRLSFTQQIPLRVQATEVSTCDVLAGVHGSGFPNLIFQEPRSAVLEFLLTSRRRPYYYRNLAHFVGQIYMSRQVCNVDAPSCVGLTDAGAIRFKEGPFREALSLAVGAVANKGAWHRDERVLPCIELESSSPLPPSSSGARARDEEPQEPPRGKSY